MYCRASLVDQMRIRKVKFRDLINMIRDDGWVHVRTTGSHMHFKHPAKPGLVTVPGGGKENRDVALGTQRSILRQAGLLQ
jgi:predicted RNA binding protein YcfA (HicA-like mRNA interferase family)